VKILHVEDNPDSRRLVRRILTRAGYHVLEAADGLEGIEVAVRERPDLILLDVDMPRLDGYETAAAMRALSPLQSSLIVALTISDSSDRERILAAGCIGYIAKPIDVDRFPEQVRAFLRGKRQYVETARKSESIQDLNRRREQRLLQKIQELEEQGWIAHDLLDGIIQSIYATGLGLEECLRLLEEDPRQARQKLAAALDALDSVISDVRNYLAGLQPDSLRDRGLSWALGELARGLERNALLVAELEVEPGIDAALTPEETRHLFHICREALTNVVKHARGSRVRLTLVRSNDIIRLSVKDDGVGFDRAQVPASGRGFRNIGARVRRLRGTLSIDSAPGQGTRVTVELPCRRAP
jgi:signal transduction histidine kinase